MSIARLEYKYLSMHLFLRSAEKFRESINPRANTEEREEEAADLGFREPSFGWGDHWRDYSSHNTQFGDLLVVQLLGVGQPGQNTSEISYGR